jgi:hypothetical protein
MVSSVRRRLGGGGAGMRAVTGSFFTAEDVSSDAASTEAFIGRFVRAVALPFFWSRSCSCNCCHC